MHRQVKLPWVDPRLEVPISAEVVVLGYLFPLSVVLWHPDVRAQSKRERAKGLVYIISSVFEMLLGCYWDELTHDGMSI